MAACLLASACGGAARQEVVPPAPAVAPVWPAASAQAEAAPAALVVLQPPLPRVLARRAVEAFFTAIVRESLPELEAALAEDASITSGPGATPESIAKVWAARFRQLDYGSARAPYRADAIGLFTRAELAALGAARGHALVPEEDELLAVVHTRGRHGVGPRHYARRLELVLGPALGGYEIRRVFEDFRLP